MDQDKDLLFQLQKESIIHCSYKGHKSNQEMLQNILVTFVLFSVNFLQGECTVDLFKIPDPNKPCHLEIVKRVTKDRDHSGSRVLETDVKSQLISTHLLFSITRAVVRFSNLIRLMVLDCVFIPGVLKPPQPLLFTKALITKHIKGI